MLITKLIDFMTLVVSAQYTSLTICRYLIHLFVDLSVFPHLNGSPKKVGTFLAVFLASSNKINPQ